MGHPVIALFIFSKNIIHISLEESSAVLLSNNSYIIEYVVVIEPYNYYTQVDDSLFIFLNLLGRYLYPYIIYIYISKNIRYDYNYLISS